MPISDDALGRIAERVIQAGRGMEDPATEFELMTAVGMLYFLEAGCDLVVLEVGLGGAWTLPMVIPAPEVAVITNTRSGAYPGAGGHAGPNRHGEIRL